MNHERMKAAHKHLRHLIQPLQQSPGLCRFMIPARPTPPTTPTTADPVAYRTIHDSQEIERLLLERNALHRSQASETPLGQEPYRSLLGVDGTSDLSEAILNGTYRPLLHPDSVSPETLLMLNQLKRSDVPPISPDITFTDFTEGIRKRPESGPKAHPRLHSFIHYSKENSKSP
jgi:hypothetical protein